MRRLGRSARLKVTSLSAYSTPSVNCPVLLITPVKVSSEQSSGFPLHLLLAFLRHRVVSCTDSEARVGVGGEDILGRLALANGKTQHLHLAVKARHTADATEGKTLAEKGKRKVTLQTLLPMTEIF